MTRWFCSLGMLALLGTSWANDDESERLGETELPPLKRSMEMSAAELQEYENLTLSEYGNREFEPEAYLGAKMIDLSPEYVHNIRQGFELIYLRQYGDARNHFADLDKQYDDSAVAAALDAVIWQALMLENFDYRYEKQYWAASSQARKDLEKVMEKPGSEAWEHFLMMGVSGIEAIHTMRRGKYLAALQLAFEAMDHIGKVKTLAPDFTDMLIADGMYNYWRTVVTMNSKVLPDFGDHRVEGIEQMQKVAYSGVFIRAPARLGMVFTWIEEGEKQRALKECVGNRKDYPENIINNLLTGTVLYSMSDYSRAIETFNAILKTDPSNERAQYWRGLSYLRQGKLDLAKADFESYLKSTYIEEGQRAYALYRMGQVHKRQKNYEQAEESWKAAVKLNKHKRSQQALDRLKSQRKAGKLK